MDERLFSRRTLFIFWLIAAAFGCAAVSMFFCGAVHRETLLAVSRRIAWRQGSIPACRGRLLSRSGKVLAWTEAGCSLRLEPVPIPEERRQKILNDAERTLKISLADRNPPRGILRENLSPEEAAACRKLLTRWPELRIVPVYRRKTDPALREKIGKIRSDEESVSQGISGWERQFDEQLSGSPGRFAVMLDRRGDWVPGTVRILFEPLHGEDVRIREVP